MSVKSLSILANQVTLCRLIKPFHCTIMIMRRHKQRTAWRSSACGGGSSELLPPLLCEALGCSELLFSLLALQAANRRITGDNVWTCGTFGPEKHLQESLIAIGVANKQNLNIQHYHFKFKYINAFK